MTAKTIVGKGFGSVDGRRVPFIASASEENSVLSHRRRRTGEDDSWASQNVWFPRVALAPDTGAPSLLEPPLIIPRHPLRSASIMSRFRTADDYISRSGFAHLPAIGDIVPELLQPEGSVTSSRVPGISARRASQLQEGDLVTGTIDITHERVYMLPVTREDHAEERKAMVCFNLSCRHPNLTHPLPPGTTPYLLENYPAVLPGRLEVGSRFQYRLVFVSRLTHSAYLTEL
jgi:hypothetical protein